MKLITPVLLAAVTVLSGCASIVSTKSYPVTISSTPPRADFSIVDKNTGKTLQMGQTPSMVTLKSGAGYFKSARYEIQVQKDGFSQETVQLKAGMDGWYLGNVIFGGLIGLLLVDPATGAMWRLQDPQNVALSESPDATYEPLEYTIPMLPEAEVPAPAAEPPKQAKCTRNPTIRCSGR